MGKFPASLLSIVFQLCLIEVVLADEQVRKAQEELRKRHLFYGTINGEVTPALTVAISSYQKNKGFNRSGRLDLETCASLGLMKPRPISVPVSTPSVLASGGELRGANGEALPNSVATNRTTDEPYVALTDSADKSERVALAAAGDDIAPLIKERRPSSSRSGDRPRRIEPRKETNPFASIFHSVDRTIRRLVGDPLPKKKRATASRL